MSEQTRLRITMRLKMLDDVFHNVIIALERLENFLEIARKGADAAQFAITGISSSRDFHNDQENPPTRESVLAEVQLQCSALFFQTKFDANEEETFKRTMNYFMTDLLEWYGGRGKEIPFDEVECCVLPILVALSRQIDTVAEIMQVFNENVAKVRSIDEFSDEEKIKAIEEGYQAWLRGVHAVGERLKEFEESGEEVKFTVHERGTIADGYNRLIQAMLHLYDTTIPVKKVRAAFTAFVEGLPEITDEALDAAMAAKVLKQGTEDVQK